MIVVMMVNTMIMTMMNVMMLIIIVNIMKMMFCFSGTLIVREGGLAINQAALMFGSKVLLCLSMFYIFQNFLHVLHISKPAFSSFFPPRAYFTYLWSHQQPQQQRKSRWFIIRGGWILPARLPLMQLNTDVMKNSFTQRGAVAKTNPGQKMPPFWRRQKARPFTFEKEC